MTDSASIRFSISRAHVPGYSSLGLDREPAFIRTCARLRWRAHEGITPGSQQASNPASHQSDANILPCVGNWDRTIERTNSLVALARSLFLPALRGDTRLGSAICCRPQITAGKCSAFLRTLIHDANQSERGLFHRLVVSPVLSFFALCHDPNMQHRSVQSHGKNHRNHG
jgi:hypothetical protein